MKKHCDIKGKHQIKQDIKILMLLATESINSRLQEAHELLPLLLGLVGYDRPVGLSLHAPQTHCCLCCNVRESDEVKTVKLWL